MSKLGDLGLGDGKRIENWEYATSALRTAATGFIAADVGKIVYQSDNGTYWRLTAVTPTWSEVGESSIQVLITVGTEAANQVSTQVQVQDSSGNSLSGNYSLTMWLADVNTPGVAVTTTVPDTTVQADEGAILVEPVTDKMLETYCNSGGLFILLLGHTTAQTWYLHVKMPDGSVQISSQIIFA